MRQTAMKMPGDKQPSILGILMRKAATTSLHVSGVQVSRENSPDVAQTFGLPRRDSSRRLTVPNPQNTVETNLDAADQRSAPRKGQSTVEFAITFSAITMPVTFAIIFTAQLLWVWHSAVEWTRDGARYAVTHCWSGAGDNVTAYMRANVPPNVDSAQFAQGAANIEVQYFQRNAETGAMETFACEGAACSTECVPDAVSVRITGYEFRRVLTYLGIPPVPLPDFRTSLPMESAGCSPGSECLQ